jgi:hypothetical protein
MILPKTVRTRATIKNLILIATEILYREINALLNGADVSETDWAWINNSSPRHPLAQDLRKNASIIEHLVQGRESLNDIDLQVNQVLL